MLNLFHHLTFAVSRLIHRPTRRIFLTHQCTSCVSCGSWVATGVRAPARTGYTQWFTNFLLKPGVSGHQAILCLTLCLLSSWYGPLGLQLNGTIVNTQRYTHNILIGVRLYGVGVCRGCNLYTQLVCKTIRHGFAFLNLYIYIYSWVYIYIYVQCCSADGATLGFNG